MSVNDLSLTGGKPRAAGVASPVNKRESEVLRVVWFEGESRGAEGYPRCESRSVGHPGGSFLG